MSRESSQSGEEETHGLVSLQSKEFINPENLNVVDAKVKLDNVIEDLNDKLVHHFKLKEEALLNQYKQQLIEQQRLLNQLKNTTNEQQIRAKMLERKAELEKERSHLIQTNMFFSQKCEQYKHTYSKLIQDSHDLEREIRFLDGQIEAANAKRLALLDDVSGSPTLNPTTPNKDTLPVFSSKKIEEHSGRKQNSTFDKTKNSTSVKKIGQSLQVMEKKNLKSNSTKNLPKINKTVFNKSQLEKLFEESVEEVKNRRKSKRAMPNLKGEQFTEYEKRAIMQIFLGNEEVKKKIYEIIFTDTETSISKATTLRGDQKTGEKVKISFEQLNM